MLGDIQNVGPEHALKNSRYPPREQDPVGDQQDHSLGESLEVPKLHADEDKYCKPNHGNE